MPDSQVVTFAYDANGNLESLDPPGTGSEAHGFTYNGVDMVTTYVPPDLGPGSEATTYTYDKDRALRTVTRSGTLEARLNYSTSTGRLDSISTARGIVGVGYVSSGQPGAGLVASLSSPDGVGLAYSYDGPKLLSETWSGPVAGSVALTYDADFRPITQLP